MQVRGRIHSNYELQVHRVTSTRGEGFLFMKSSMCSNFFSVTSRRGSPTSRRQINTPLSRRDVYFHVATSIYTSLCHVAMCIFTSRREFVQASITSRRRPARHDVLFTCLCHVATWDSNVATWIKSTLCHVATLPPTSRRRLVKLSVTSRRDPARRDVALV